MTHHNLHPRPDTPASLAHRVFPALRHPLLIMALLAFLAGCGGGSGSGNDPVQDNDDTTTISGTAAAGAPIAGFVGARDSNGTTVTADIASDGSYQLDLAQLQPPVLIFANGISGGTAYQILSVAFASDLGETVNVTPLTDVIVGNTARKSPTEFFNDPTGLENFTEETVEDEVTRLRTRLGSILDAVGVPEDFDLRSSAFVADRSGFDQVLDVVEVTTDDQGGATLRNRLDGQTIDNNFQNPEAETQELAAGDDFDARTAALENIGETFNTLADLIALSPGERPQDYQAQLEALLTDTVRIDGFDRNSLLALFTETDPEALADLQQELVPQLRGWALISLDTATGEAVANAGSTLGGWQLQLDDTSSTWRINGNQAAYFVDAEPEFFFDPQGELANSELLVEIDPRDFGDFGPDDYFVITGPGLPADGIAFNRDTSGTGEFGVTLSLTQSLRDAIANGADFDITRFTDDDGDTVIDDQGQRTGNDTDTTQETLTTRVRRASPDTTGGTPQFGDLSGNADTGELSVAWSLPEGYRSISLTLDRNPGGRVLDQALSADNDLFTTTVAAPQDPEALESEVITLFTRDAFGVTVAVSIASPFNWSASTGEAVWDEFNWDDGSTWQ